MLDFAGLSQEDELTPAAATPAIFPSIMQYDFKAYADRVSLSCISLERLVCASKCYH